MGTEFPSPQKVLSYGNDHFTDEATEAQKGEVTWPSSPNEEWQSWDSILVLLDSRACKLSHQTLLPSKPEEPDLAFYVIQLNSV